MERISVVVPVYNCEMYIKECVESILAQTYPEIEIVLVDDGSSDKSGFICDEYAKKYESIISIHQDNRGISSARLSGARASKGTWITFVDSDDWIDENFYQVLCTGETDCDLVISGIYRYYDSQKCVKESTYYEPGIYDKKRIAEEVIPNMLWNPSTGIWSLDPSLCTKIFRREKIICQLERAANVKSDYGEDSMVIFPMMFHIDKMKVIDGSFYYHRQRADGVIPYYIQDKLFFEKLHSVYRYLKNEFYHAGYQDVMEEQLDHFYMNSVILKRKAYGTMGYRLFPVFPFSSIEKGSKVVLYGAGKVGKAYMEQNEKYKFCDIIFWADKNPDAVKYEKGKSGGPEEIKKYKFDYVVIAIDKYETALKAKQSLCRIGGVPEEKIIWHSIRRHTGKL